MLLTQASEGKHSSCLPQSLYKNSPRKNRERKVPALSLSPRQGNSRQSELPFYSQTGGSALLLLSQLRPKGKKKANSLTPIKKVTWIILSASLPLLL